MRVLPFIVLAIIIISTAKASLCQQARLAPQNLSLCEVMKNPRKYDGKKIQIRVNVDSAFESFVAYDSSCAGTKTPSVWLMFGGDVDCPTPSTWNDVNRAKGKNVKFDGVEYSLVKDKNFRKFHKAVALHKHDASGYQIMATLEGTFFAGEAGDTMPGYGHLGCCYLFIIHQISDIDAKKKPIA